LEIYATGGSGNIPHVQPPGKRLAGILLPAFTPRREGDLGIGDTLALREWIDWAADHQVGFIQLLPINENGADESPYSAISSVALDPIYLACEEIPGLKDTDLEKARDQLNDALDSPLVNYPLVRAVKRNLLEIAWRRFDKAGPELKEDFDRFRKLEEEWLDDYCLFRFLMEIHGEALTWDHWPEPCRTPEKARGFLAKLRKKDAVMVDSRLGFFAFIQWLCFRQWLALRAHADERGVKLMGDVPIGIAWHSSDVYFARDEFLLDWCGGSPPEGAGQSDPFFQQWGQNWGIPLYRWDYMQENGFAWWQKRITRLTRIFQIFRLDHILGFYRIYAFPWRPERNGEFIGLSHEQAAALTGGHLPHWVLRPDDSVENKAANRADGDIRLRAILQAAKGAEVIAEDLGWVPEYVRPHLADLGIAGFRIPHWDCDHGHPTPGNAFPENTFATYSTHDHDPVNGIWRGCLRAIQQHQEHPTEQSAWSVGGAYSTLRILSEFAGIPIPHHSPWPPYTEGIRLRLLKALFASNSHYAVLMITELFGIDHRFNHPGTSGGENWRFRLPWTLEEILEDPQLKSTCDKLASIISITHRA
jgi:4-alpha-glucanotransferase